MPRDYQLPHTLTRWRSEGQRDIYGQTGYSVEVMKCRFTEINKLLRLRDFLAHSGQFLSR